MLSPSHSVLKVGEGGADLPYQGTGKEGGDARDHECVLRDISDQRAQKIQSWKRAGQGPE